MHFPTKPEIKTGIVLLQSCDCTSFVDLYRMAQTIFPKVTDVLHRWDPYPSGPGWIQNYTGVYSNPKTPVSQYFLITLTCYSYCNLLGLSEHKNRLYNSEHYTATTGCVSPIKSGLAGWKHISVQCSPHTSHLCNIV